MPAKLREGTEVNKNLKKNLREEKGNRAQTRRLLYNRTIAIFALMYYNSISDLNTNFFACELTFSFVG